MPTHDSVTVTTAPCSIARMSPPLIDRCGDAAQNSGSNVHRQVREGFAEPLLLQLGELAGLPSCLAMNSFR